MDDIKLADKERTYFELPNRLQIVRAINLMMFDKRLSYRGVAKELNISYVNMCRICCFHNTKPAYGLLRTIYLYVRDYKQ